MISLALDNPELLKPEHVTLDHKWVNLPSHDVSVYNSWDIETGGRLKPILRAELKRAGQLAFFDEWFEVAGVAMRMQLRGFGHLDRPAHDALKIELENERLQVESEVMSKCEIFDAMEQECEQWLADYIAKNGEKAAKRREIGYNSRRNKLKEKREKFFGKSDLMRDWLFGRGSKKTKTTDAVYAHSLNLKPQPKAEREKRAERSISIGSLMWVMEHFRKMDEHHRPTLEALIHIAKLSTILNRYMFTEPELKLLASRDYRLYPIIKLYAQESLRWSFTEPALHQWTPRMRKIVRARKGYSFTSRDFSQIEMGINAILAKATRVVEAFLDPNRDLHIETALDSLNWTLEQWLAQDEDRQKGIRNMFKSSGYRRQYGGEGGTVAENTKICPCVLCRVEEGKGKIARPLTAAQMKLADQRWRVKNPEIIAFRNFLVDHVRNHQNSWTSPHGYRRVWCGPIDAIKRSIFNFPNQHGVSEIMRRCMLEMDPNIRDSNHAARELRRIGAILVMNYHDELIHETPKGTEQDVLDITKEVMERPVPEFDNVSFPTSGGFGELWSDLK